MSLGAVSAGEFLQGLTTPRIANLVAAAALALLMLAGTELALQRGALWQLPVGWVLSTPYDDWSHASWQTGRMAHRHDDGPLVVLIGGSAAREAVISNASVSEALGGRGVDAVEFVNLGTRNQTLAEALLLTEQLPTVRHGAVLYSVHPMFLRDGPRDWAEAAGAVRFPFVSPTLARQLAEIAPELDEASRWHLLRLRPQLVNWITSRVRHGAATHPLRYRNHLYANKGPMSDAELLRLLGWIGKRLPGYASQRDANLRLLGAAIELARSKGYRVGIVELPRNPVAERRVLAPVLEDYRAALGELARRHGVPHIDYHALLDYPRRAFYDHIHFLTATRESFQPHLVAGIERVLGGD